ncbi:hypothetical protein IWQ61_004552 [Dispira simplex]|nr:hypothetical protein IWQ61_004552 [Dispira simplex]
MLGQHLIRSAVQASASLRTVSARELRTSAFFSAKKFGELGGRWVDPDPQIDDYPNLPHVSTYEKPPLGWDNMQDRRNFGDTVQEQDEILGAWGPTVYPGDTRTVLRDWSFFAAFIGLVSTVAYITYPEPNFERRTYPFDGLRVELGGDPNSTNDRRFQARTHVQALPESNDE